MITVYVLQYDNLIRFSLLLYINICLATVGMFHRWIALSFRRSKARKSGRDFRTSRTPPFVWYVIMQDVSCTDYMPFLVPCFIYIRVYIRYIYIYIHIFPWLVLHDPCITRALNLRYYCGYYMQGQNLRQFLRIHFELQMHRNQQQRGRTILRLPPITN